MSCKEPSFSVSLIAGGIAGTAVDVALFPLDTIKTRFQSEKGFRASGGFRGIYSGLGPAAIASAPNGGMCNKSTYGDCETEASGSSVSIISSSN